MLIKNLKASGVLSFGPEGIDLPMLPLNVLIGTNGSGKSNLLEVLNLFREAPSPRHSIAGPMIEDGVREWLWKGIWNSEDGPASGRIECVVEGRGGHDLKHFLGFCAHGYRLVIEDESIELATPENSKDAWWFYRWLNSAKPDAAAFHDSEVGEKGIRYVPHDTLDEGASILAQVRDPNRYAVFAHLERQYSGMELYRNWTFGPNAEVRRPSRVDDRQDRLQPLGRNLATVVAAMTSPDRHRVLDALKELYPGIKDLRSKPAPGGALQLFLEEEGGREIPASRLSDGTLRFLSLLVILLDPSPPSLIAIEEPELGMHPDIIPLIARLLIEASSSTQLIVTTHSRLLIDCLEGEPESIIVCERHERGTVLERLESDRLKVWLENYSLGELWSRGELGGNRW